MSTPREILTGPMQEASRLLSKIPFTPEACIQLLATGLQESRLIFRRQHNDGPARGLFQFERGGGVHGVLTHPASKAFAIQLCIARKVTPTEMAVWNALETDDVLAIGFARLLYWTSPKSMPDRNDANAGWQLYLDCWRPGQPKPDTWQANHAAAVSAVIASEL